VAASRLTEDVMPPDMFEKLTPDYIAGIVAYLCSESCRETGAVFNAAAGYYSRAAILTGPGITLGDGKNPPTPEDIRDHWTQINNLDGVREMGDATLAVMSFMTPPKAEEKQETKDAGETLNVKGVFEKMPAAFNAEKAAGKDIIFQFNISGPGGGDWFVTIKDGACRVEAGMDAKPTTTIKMAEGDFLQLIQGKLDGMQAFSAGKLKVEGDIMKAQLIGKLFKFKA
jgi:putative sterol carrier protein